MVFFLSPLYFVFCLLVILIINNKFKKVVFHFYSVYSFSCIFVICQFSDQHPKEIEDLWSTLCACWPNNLKVIIRYLVIISGMAPNELLPYVSIIYVFLFKCNCSALFIQLDIQLVIHISFNLMLYFLIWLWSELNTNVGRLNELCCTWHAPVLKGFSMRWWPNFKP